LSLELVVLYKAGEDHYITSKCIDWSLVLTVLEDGFMNVFGGEITLKEDLVMSSRSGIHKGRSFAIDDLDSVVGEDYELWNNEGRSVINVIKVHSGSSSLVVVHRQFHNIQLSRLLDVGQRLVPSEVSGYLVVELSIAAIERVLFCFSSNDFGHFYSADEERCSLLAFAAGEGVSCEGQLVVANSKDVFPEEQVTLLPDEESSALNYTALAGEGTGRNRNFEAVYYVDAASFESLAVSVFFKRERQNVYFLEGRQVHLAIA